MASYLVSYDLIQQKNYPKIIDAIKSYNVYCNVLLSTWIINTTSDEVQIRDHLLRSLDQDDKLVVLKLSPRTGAWYNVGSDVDAWLKASL